MSASDEEENYWPGYVDALTTMTMVLTFIMLVLGLAVFSLSQNVSKGMLETIATAMKIKDSIPQDISSDDLAKLVIERIEKKDADFESAQKAVEIMKSARGTTGGDLAGGKTNDASAGASLDERRIESTQDASKGRSADAIDMRKQDANLRLIYKARATGLDDAAKAEVTKAFAPDTALRNAAIIEIIAGVDKASPAVTDGNRIAYYRALTVRGQLIEAGIPAEKLRVKLDPTLAGEELLISGR
jgi:hypothetical protein